MTIKTEPSFIKNKGKISETYKTAGVYGSFLNKCRLAAYEHAIKKHDICLDEVLDVGCSYGSWSENWLQLGFNKLYGIDPNDTIIADARKVYDEVYLGDAQDIHKYFSKKNVIAANGVLVHILKLKEVEIFFDKIKENLSREGLFIFSVLNARHYISPKGFVPCSGPNSCSRNIEDYDKILKKLNLRIVDKIGTFINPWCMEELRFFCESSDLKNNQEVYDTFYSLSKFLRQAEKTSLFSEILYIVSSE